ncbi:ComF family protein [Corynebacterium sp. L4756]
MELLLPKHCAGCKSPGAVLCAACQEALRQAPVRVHRQMLADAPFYSLGAYSELRRNVIIAMKEYNNRAVRPYVGAVVAAGLRHVIARGDIPDEVVLVPAPTRKKSAALRGGDPVLQICQQAGKQVQMPVINCVRIKAGALDQSGLNAQRRRENMRRSVAVISRVPKLPVMLVDDVMTTGSTLMATAEALRGAGAEIAGGIVFAHV